jgi:phosphoribosyl-AMP cyclohydrolase
MIRRLILANFDHTSTFLTLTFAENMQNIEEANYEFKKFVQKLKRKVEGFKHVTVIEFQKRGAIHYHMISNIPVSWRTEKERKQASRDLGDLWGNGFADIKDIGQVDNVGAYLVKYMTKDNLHESLEGKKAYFYSRNLEKPQVLTGEEAITWHNTLQGNIPVFTSQYSHEMTGNVEYSEFNLMRLGE